MIASRRDATRAMCAYPVRCAPGYTCTVHAARVPLSPFTRRALARQLPPQTIAPLDPWRSQA